MDFANEKLQVISTQPVFLLGRPTYFLFVFKTYKMEPYFNALVVSLNINVQFFQNKKIISLADIILC